jgi:hypothetical protein
LLILAREGANGADAAYHSGLLDCLMLIALGESASSLSDGNLELALPEATETTPWTFSHVHHAGTAAAAAAVWIVAKYPHYIYHVAALCATRIICQTHALKLAEDNSHSKKLFDFTLRLLSAARKILLAAHCEYVTAIAWMLAAMIGSSNYDAACASSFRPHVLSALKFAIRCRR